MKQTLKKRNTYTPTNAPQVRCNCDPSLNRGKAVGEAIEETLSVPGLKTFSNNSDVDLLVSRVPDNGTCEFPFQKLSSIEHENDCRFVNPAYTHPRSTIHPLSEDRGILYPLTPI